MRRFWNEQSLTKYCKKTQKKKDGIDGGYTSAQKYTTKVGLKF